MEMKQALFTLSLLLFSSLYSTTTLAQPPAAAPNAPKPAPAKPAPASPAAAPKPLVPTLPQSPDSGSAPQDITKILKKAKEFSVLLRLLKSTQIMDNVNSQLINSKDGGLTILAPTDGAFAQLKAGFLNSLNDDQKIELIQFHILPAYVASNNFDSLSNPVQTVAGVNPTRLRLDVTSYGNSVNFTTGVVNATITGIVYSDKSLAIYRLDKVLLPLDLFQPKAPAAAPALAKAPKAAKEKSSADDGDDQDDTTAKDNSGAISLNMAQGTTFMSLIGVALVALATIRS